MRKISHLDILVHRNTSALQLLLFHEMDIEVEKTELNNKRMYNFMRAFM